MRLKAFGPEPAGSLLDSRTVAVTSLDALLGDVTGHVIDVRREGPLATHVAASLVAAQKP